jgi:transcription initiation factor IIE alpha subunit
MNEVFNKLKDIEKEVMQLVCPKCNYKMILPSAKTNFIPPLCPVCNTAMDILNDNEFVKF